MSGPVILRNRLRGSSASPGNPAWANRRRHNTTVGSEQPTRSAISGPVRPSLDSSTIRPRHVPSQPTTITDPAVPAPSVPPPTRPKHAPDSACFSVPLFSGTLKLDTRRNTRW